MPAGWGEGGEGARRPARPPPSIGSGDPGGRPGLMPETTAASTTGGESPRPNDRTAFLVLAGGVAILLSIVLVKQLQHLGQRSKRPQSFDPAVVPAAEPAGPRPVTI